MTATATLTHATTGDRRHDALLDDVLTKAQAFDCLTLEQVGHLLGDDPQAAWRGPNADRLCSYARAGALVTVENAEWVEYRDDAGRIIARRVREHLSGLHVRRADLAAWLAERGTDSDRQSRAATWAHSTEA